VTTHPNRRIRMVSSLVTLPALLVGAVVFVVLFVILGVTLWVSILAGIVGFALTHAFGSGARHSRKPHTA
jgi:hypothetical protein